MPANAKKKCRKGPSQDPSDPNVTFAVLGRLRDLPIMTCKDFRQRAKHILVCGKIHEMMLAAEEAGLVSGCREGKYKLTEHGLYLVECFQAKGKGKRRLEPVTSIVATS